MRPPLLHGIFPSCRKGKLVTVMTFDGRGPPQGWKELLTSKNRLWEQPCRMRGRGTMCHRHTFDLKTTKRPTERWKDLDWADKKTAWTQNPVQNPGRSARTWPKKKEEEKRFPHRKQPDPSTIYSALAYRRAEYLVIINRFSIPIFLFSIPITRLRDSLLATVLK